MRNLKSMVAFLVVAAMLFASFTTFAYNDVAADADYATAVEVLSALEILKGDDKGNFNPDNTITRAESAAVIVRLLGLEEAAAGAAGATQFVDVAADHWGSGYINMAAQSGIIAGYGDGNFGPEDAVTYEQFVKMLVCALGYEPQALTKGTYPTGYLIAAKEMKLTKGVTGAAGQEAARSVVAELAYNALDLPLMEQSGWGSDIKYEVQEAEINDDKSIKTEAKTLLSEKLEIYKVAATVGEITDVEKIDLTLTENCETNKDLKAGAKSAFVNGVSVSAFVGYTVDAYLVDGAKKNTYDLVAIAISDDLTSIVLNGKEISFKADAKNKYVVYEDENEEEVELIYDVDAYFVNGESKDVPVYDKLAKAANYTYEFLVNEDDEIKTIFASVYEYAIVDEYNEARERIDLKSTTLGTKKYIALDEETLEDKAITLVDVNGAVVNAADLKEDDVLVLKDAAKALDIIVVSEAIEGKVTGTSTDKEIGEVVYTIGDAKYPVSAKGFNIPKDGDGKVALMGKEGTFYLDNQGFIVNFEATEVAVNLAFVLSYKAGDTTHTVKVLNKDGVKTFTLQEDVKVDIDAKDGKKVDYDAALDTLKGITELKGDKKIAADHINNNLFDIEVNANGVITKLVRKADKLTEQKDVPYSAKLTKLNEYLSEDVVIFNMPTGETVNDLSISALASLVNEKEYTYYVLDTDKETKFVTAMVITAGAGAASLEAPIAIVTGAATVYDEEETEITELTLLVAGEEKTILSETAYAEGDVITYVEDGEGKIDSAKLIAKIAEKDGTNNVITLKNKAAVGTEGEEGYVPAEDLYGIDTAKVNRSFAYGYVADINEYDVVKLANGVFAGDEVTEIKLTETTEVYTVDFSKKAPFAVATIADLEESDLDAFPEAEDDKTAELHYALFVLDEDGALVSMIIVVPAEDLGEKVVKA